MFELTEFELAVIKLIKVKIAEVTSRGNWI